MEEIQDKFIEVNGLKLHVAEVGTGERFVVFLHGFPEIWYSWRHQMIAASNAGKLQRTLEEEERELLPLIKAMELSKEQHENVFEQCLGAMQNTHSHLFRFFIEGLLPHDALHYLDLVIKSSDEELTASILCMITE